MNKFDIKFEEIKEQRMETDNNLAVETEEKVTLEQGMVRKTVIVGILAGLGAFIAINFVSFALQTPLLESLKVIYQELLSKMFIEEEVGEIIQQFNWQHILLAIHQQFSGILSSNSYGETLGEDGLFGRVQLGLGFLLIIPFFIVWLTYSLCKRWICQGKTSNTIFLFVTSFVYAFLMGMISVTAGQTITFYDYYGYGTTYYLTYSNIHVFLFSMMMCLLFLYIPIKLRQMKIRNNRNWEVNQIFDACKLCIWMFVICYLLMAVVTFPLIGKQTDNAILYILILSPFLFAISLFSPLEQTWLESGRYEFFSYSIFQHIHVEGHISKEWIYFVENDGIKLAIYIFILLFVVTALRKGYVIAKYSTGNSVKGIVMFMVYYSAFITIGVHLASYKILLSQYPNKIVMELKVEELLLLLHSFIIGTCFSLIGAIFYYLKLKRNG